MTLPSLRIAVSGPSGAGKSTLVAALAKELGLPVLEEGMGPIYEAKRVYLDAVRQPAQPKPEQDKALALWMQSYFNWCASRDQLYAQHDGLVADRWELDILGYWMQVFGRYRPDADTRQLYELFLTRARTFDLIVVLPMASSPVTERNEAGLRRAQDFTSQLLTQSTFAGLLQQVPQDVARYAPPAVESVTKRVADVVRLIGLQTSI